MKTRCYIGWEFVRQSAEREINALETYSTDTGRALRALLRRLDSWFEEFMDREITATDWELMTGLDRSQLGRDVASGVLKDRRLHGNGPHRVKIRDVVRTRGLDLPPSSPSAWPVPLQPSTDSSGEKE